MTKTTTILRWEAQDQIIEGAINAALAAEERDDEDLANAIREEAAKLARRWKLFNVAGLPSTFKGNMG